MVSDALTLARQADLVLSVVSIEHTLRRDFAAHCEIIASTDRLHGILINGVDRGPYGGGAESEDRGGYRRWLPNLIETSRSLVKQATTIYYNIRLEAKLMIDKRR